jgi:serine/threonine protein kinase
MSPEQVEDPRLANAMSDIYSLGCTMYYILTGAPPFRGTSVPETLIMHARDPIPKLRARRPDAPPELEAVYEKMLAKRPSNRYQTMNEVIAALDAVRNGKAREPALPTMEFAADDPMAAPVKPYRPPSSDSFVKVSSPTGTEQDVTTHTATSRDLSLEKNVSLPGLPSTPEPQKSLSAFDMPHDQTLELMRRQQMMTWLLVGLVGLVAVLLAVIVIMFLNQPKPTAASRKPGTSVTRVEVLTSGPDSPRIE